MIKNNTVSEQCGFKVGQTVKYRCCSRLKEGMIIRLTTTKAIIKSDDDTRYIAFNQIEK